MDPDDVNNRTTHNGISGSSTPDQYDASPPVTSVPDVYLERQHSDTANYETIQVTVEEPWNDTIEDRLRLRLADAKDAERAHKRAGYEIKHRYRILTVIIITWASIILIADGLVECDIEPVYRVTRTIISAFGVFFNALFGALNLGYWYREHFDYEVKYFEISQDIEYMLMREREFRLPADAFMTEIRERLKKLKRAPEFPKFIYPS